MRVVYIADDGKEFDNKLDCEDYEWILDHKELKNVKVYDNRTGELFDNIITEEIFLYGDKVIIPTKSALKDLQDWGKYCGYLDYAHQFTEAGTWVFNENENVFRRVFCED